jgi:hypothetical protein
LRTQFSQRNEQDDAEQGKTASHGVGPYFLFSFGCDRPSAHAEVLNTTEFVQN